MADNSEEEILDNLANSQSENLSDEIISTKDTEIINPKQETANMEVHHHPHVKKKPFKEYFLEFLMIFLAVTMGFFAESYREHLVNKEIEKRNIETFISNVQKDSANLIAAINFNQDKIKLIDSLVKIPGNFTDTLFQKYFFPYMLQLIYIDGYQPDESAFLQMQSSGTLRLIKHQNITDSILNYQSYNQIIKLEQEAINKSFQSSSDNIIQATDLRAFVNGTPPKLNGNNQVVQNYINYKMAENVTTKIYIRFLQRQLLNITNLIPFLKKEYDIE
ncbi:MAG: hypothetical protein ABIT05_13610 [Chitinophagaceae bacterium]